MKLTDIFKFKLFERTDPVDMKTVNENFESVEKLFKGLDQVDNTSDCDKNVASAKKAECDGNGKNISETYLKKTAVANNNTTTEAGFALDARQANPNVDGSLAKQISALNDGLKKCGIYEQIAGRHSASVNTSTTLTVQDITKYRYLIITGRYGDVVRATHFVVTSQVINDMKKYQLWCGSKSIGTVQFNSATSITFTQEEITYAPMYVYGIY